MIHFSSYYKWSLEIKILIIAFIISFQMLQMLHFQIDKSILNKPYLFEIFFEMKLIFLFKIKNKQKFKKEFSFLGN